MYIYTCIYCINPAGLGTRIYLDKVGRAQAYSLQSDLVVIDGLKSYLIELQYWFKSYIRISVLPCFACTPI